MKGKLSMLIICGVMLLSVTAFEQNGFAASVDTVGELNATGGVRFPDGNLQTSACSGCAGGVLTIELGGTGGNTASEARTNLGVPGLATANSYTFGPQTFQSGAAGLNALIVQGAPGQTANLQEWRNSGGTALVSVGSTGEINLPATAVVRSGGALFIHNNSNGNIAIGRAALVSNTEGAANAAVGYYSISQNVSGGYNTAVGYQSLYNTTSSHNTAVGANALFSNTEGGFNTTMGSNSLNANTKGSYNMASGYQALKGNTTANYNTALGARALLTQSFNNGDTFWDSHNTAVGYEALYSNQPTTTDNGVYNTAIGSGVLRTNTTGYRNTAIGYQAMYANTSGRRNTASGYAALLGNTSGYYNSAFGYAALYGNTTGNNNTAIGHWAGDSYQNGTNNTFLGASADAAAEDLTNATAIGYGAEVTASNMVRIGNGAVTVIQGAVNFTIPSDIRIKKDVEDIGQGLEFIKVLRPVQYRLKNGNERIDFGFIAQDIETLLGADYNVLGIGADADRTLSLRYTDFIAPMVKAMQEQQGMIEQLKAEVAELKRMMGK